MGPPEKARPDDQGAKALILPLLQGEVAPKVTEGVCPALRTSSVGCAATSP